MKDDEVIAKVGCAQMILRRMLGEERIVYEINGKQVERADFDSYVAAFKADPIAATTVEIPAIPVKR